MPPDLSLIVTSCTYYASVTICYANFGNLKRTHLINLLYPPKTMQSFLSFNACSYQGIKHNHKNMSSVWCISKDINRYIAEQHADGWANYPLFFGLTLRKTIKTYTNFVWRSVSEGILKDYRVTCVTFDMSASLFVDNMCVQWNASDFTLEYPFAAN